MDNVGIVVESLDAAISFFAELGLELEGRSMIEGDWSGRVTGLRDQRVEIAMMRMPDGHGGIELSRFLTPPPVADHRNAPVNALGSIMTRRCWKACSPSSAPGLAEFSPTLRRRPRGYWQRRVKSCEVHAGRGRELPLTA